MDIEVRQHGADALLVIQHDTKPGTKGAHSYVRSEHLLARIPIRADVKTREKFMTGLAVSLIDVKATTAQIDALVEQLRERLAPPPKPKPAPAPRGDKPPPAPAPVTASKSGEPAAKECADLHPVPAASGEKSHPIPAAAPRESATSLARAIKPRRYRNRV